jgi:hypothetical protein
MTHARQLAANLLEKQAQFAGKTVFVHRRFPARLACYSPVT